MLSPKNSFLVLLLGVTFFTNNPLTAQNFEIGLGGGMTHYKGELYPRFKPLAFNGGANAFVRYNISDAVSIKGTGMIGNISANEKRVNETFNKERGLSFNTLLWEAGGQIEYNFLNFRSRRALYSSDWTPYVFGGVNYYAYIKKKTVGSSTFSGYTGIANSKNGGSNYTLPFGIGMKKSINYNLNLNFEFGARKTFSDTAIDGIGFKKNNDGKLVSNFQETGVPNNIIEARNGGHITYPKDMYFYTNISISYVFNKVHCPPSGKRRFIIF